LLTQIPVADDWMIARPHHKCQAMNWLYQAIEINNHEASIAQRPSKLPENDTGSRRCRPVEAASTTTTTAAIPALQRAVTVMRQFHHCLQHEAMDIAAPPRTAVIRSHDAAVAAAVAFAFERDSEGPFAYSTGYGFVYHRLLLVPTSLQYTNLNNVEDLEAVGLMVSTTCLFNLALSWHGLALQQATTASSLKHTQQALSKAEQFYRLILTVLEHPECGHGRDDSYTVLKCLVLNNRAQLHCAQGDPVSAQESRNALCSLLLTANELLDEYLGPAVAKELKLNLLHWQMPTVALAA
jgi:hypothetical protein